MSPDPRPIPRPDGAPTAPLVDIGVNLTDRQFAADRATVIERAEAFGVVHQLLTGTDVAHARAAADLAAADPARLSATAGVHPHHADEVTGAWIADLEALVARDGVRAVGEAGLDFARDFSPRADQERVFEAQLELAARTGLPLFLHERDSGGRFFEILAPWIGRVHGVLHCFTGGAEALDAALDAGLHLGITGWICDERRGADLRECVGRIPDDRLLIETDAPWLLPRTVRPRRKSRRNEPAFLPWIAVEVARHRGVDADTVARQTTRNATRLFALPPEKGSASFTPD